MKGSVEKGNEHYNTLKGQQCVFCWLIRH